VIADLQDPDSILICAGRRVSPGRYTTNGRRSSWREPRRSWDLTHSTGRNSRDQAAEARAVAADRGSLKTSKGALNPLAVCCSGSKAIAKGNRSSAPEEAGQPTGWSGDTFCRQRTHPGIGERQARGFGEYNQPIQMSRAAHEIAPLSPPYAREESEVSAALSRLGREWPMQEVLRGLGDAALSRPDLASNRLLCQLTRPAGGYDGD